MTDQTSPLPHVVMEWTTLHFVEEPKKGAFALSFIAVISFLIQWNYNETYLTALSVLFLVGSLSKFFFPITFTLDDTHVRIRGLIFPHERPWTEFKRMVIFPDGVLLSPFAQPSRLDNYRSMFIRFKNNREEVLAFLRAKIPQ